MEYSLGPFDGRTEALLQGLHDQLEKTLDYSDKLPGILWHYTSAEGLRAIMSHHTLRLSHARFMNDPTEVEHGWLRAGEALQKAMAVPSHLQNFFEMTHSVMGEVYNAPQYFIFCLSAREDSLSQWRAYADAGEGYALGFESGKLLEATEPDVTCILLPLIYRREEQDALFEHGISVARAFWEKLLLKPVERSWQEGILHRANVTLSRFMLRGALLCKDASFEDEQEWRLLTALRADTESCLPLLKQVDFRADGPILKPFLDVPISPSQDWRLPIRRVMYGPTLRPKATEESLRFFLERRGYVLEPEPSKVPLQA